MKPFFSLLATMNAGVSKVSKMLVISFPTSFEFSPDDLLLICWFALRPYTLHYMFATNSVTSYYTSLPSWSWQCWGDGALLLPSAREHRTQSHSSQWAKR